MSTYRLLIGDCRESMASLPDASVQTCVTSPPYWGLRDYGHADQLGLEPTPEQSVANMVDVFREVRRVLRDDATLWLNLGDSYAATQKGSGGTERGTIGSGAGQSTNAGSFYDARFNLAACGLKPKDLVGIPWRVAFALQADGWYLRSDIIWSKPNPMPESVTDRPTKAHEYVFLLSKSERYFYDVDAIREPHTSVPDGVTPIAYADTSREQSEREGRPGFRDSIGVANRPKDYFGNPAGRNARSVWNIATAPFKGAHFATFPPELAERCILAGSAKGDTVLDPFAGSGTTGMVATGHGRNAILCELNPDYAPLIRDRIGALLESAA